MAKKAKGGAVAFGFTRDAEGVTLNTAPIPTSFRLAAKGPYYQRRLKRSEKLADLLRRYYLEPAVAATVKKMENDLLSWYAEFNLQRGKS